MHAGDARMLLYVPAVQIEHEEEPSEENVPEALSAHKNTSTSCPGGQGEVFWHVLRGKRWGRGRVGGDVLEFNA